MISLARHALDVAAGRPQVTYADVRIQESRGRALATKSGRLAGASSSESYGIGIRVIADGAWGFAATDDLTKPGVEAAAKLAVDIALASATTSKHAIRLAA